MSPFVRRGMLLLGVAVSLFVAIWLGQVVGHFIGERKMAAFESFRQEGQRALLSKLLDLGRTERLFSYPFIDITGNRTTLGEQVESPSLVTYLSMNCDGCMSQINHLRSLLSDSQDSGQFIFIVQFGDQMALQFLAEQFGPHSVYLADDSSFVSSLLDTMPLPLSLIVKPDTSIAAVIAGRVTRRDLEPLSES